MADTKVIRAADTGLYHQQLVKLDHFFTECDAVEECLRDCANAAKFDFPVFLHGATGTGKNFLAQAIHNEGRRSKLPFVEVNLASLHDGGLESGLFGHKKGAFTGAFEDHDGAFVQAHGGTLFLDEVHALSHAQQRKVMNAIEQGMVPVVGGKSKRVHARVILATKLPLPDAVGEGRPILEDLFYRVSKMTIRIVPCRERRDDLLFYFGFYLRCAAEKCGRPAPAWTPEVARLIREFSWPGNLRQMKNLAWALVTKGCSDVLGLQEVLRRLKEISPNEASAMGTHTAPAVLTRKMVTDALRETRGNRRAAARLLGISKTTLLKHINRRLAEMHAEVENGLDLSTVRV